MKRALPLEIREKSRVLVAPLDWGLGHATRCIPLIRELEKTGALVWLAGEGAQEALLRSEFPHLPFLPLEGYRVRYSRKAGAMGWKILSQVPRIKKAIRAENAWLKKMQVELGFDLIISDNRYGLHHPNAKSVIITHQLTIKTGMGSWTESILQKWNYKYLERFDECWVPDEETNGGLAGELSHPVKKPSIPLKYIGPLSRFVPIDIPVKKNKLLIILSGPEPQRSMLEDIILRDIAHYNGEATIVRGLPNARTHIPSTSMINIYNHLDSHSLNREFCESEYIIARSGYSTIMDSFELGKKCIFIPTPGQTEQEYLGKYLMEKRQAIMMSQKDLTLEAALLNFKKG